MKSRVKPPAVSMEIMPYVGEQISKAAIAIGQIQS